MTVQKTLIPLLCKRNEMKVTQLCLILATPWTVVHEASLSMGFSRQEQWSGLPFPSPRDLPDPGIKPESPALQADSLLTELWGKPSHDMREASPILSTINVTPSRNSEKVFTLEYLLCALSIVFCLTIWSGERRDKVNLFSEPSIVQVIS